MNYKKAIKLHKINKVIDCHLDLPNEIFNRVNRGEKNIIKNYYLDNFRDSGINFVVCAIFIENIYLPEKALTLALQQIKLIKDEINSLKEDLLLIKTKEDFNNAVDTNKIGLILSLEGLEPIGNNIDLLDTFYDLGVRGAGLTWSRRNYVADGSFFSENEEGKKGGLTDFGVEVVKRMEKLNMFIDISHLNDEGVDDIIKFTTKPFIASHSNARKVNNIMRNLSDKHIIATANSGGTIGINNIIPIVDVERKGNYVQKMCDHIDYINSLVGCNHISLGFDLCSGIEETCLRFGNNKIEVIDSLKNHKDSILITEELLNRGYSDEDIIKILGANISNIIVNNLK